MNLLSVPEAAARIKCSRGHIYGLIADGKLDRYNIARKGSKVRISEESVDRFIAEASEPVRKASA